MAELPFELQKLPPSALDVLRFFSTNENQPADDVDIMDGSDLSERSFSKAIKRLVTKHFAEMDAFRNYCLTDKGVHLMNELLAYDVAVGGVSVSTPAATSSVPVTPATTDPVQRRLTLVVPEPIVAEQTTKIYAGLDAGLPSGHTEVILRLQAMNSTPETHEATLAVEQGAAHAIFEVSPGKFDQVRLRIEALQADAYSGDLHVAGGMYIDIDVTFNENEEGQLAAFGTDIMVMPL